ncbi:hypothetical protein SLS58_005447 [Diplodia intermedia]|uniref:BTB domain-containing protein n=1 Tax=Diplodia intermedia TaxID=856260 RepID=A0ABR3TR08_9PEZI
MTLPYNFDGKHNERVQRAALITGETITVVVGGGGDDRETACSFAVHRTLICAFSPFFAAACRGPWKENRSGVVALPEQDPATFELYVKWLYTGELLDFFWGAAGSSGNDNHDNNNHDDNNKGSTDIVTSSNSSKGAEDEGQAGKKAEDDVAVVVEDPMHTAYTTFACAYFLGDALLDAAFKNVVVDAIIKRVRETDHYPCALAALIYKNTPGGESRLRRLLVDFYAYAHDDGWFVGSDTALDMDDAPREFFRDVLLKMIWIKEFAHGWAEYPWVCDPCRYHEHPSGFSCPDALQNKPKEDVDKTQ